MRTTILVLAKSAIAARPNAEMQTLAQAVSERLTGHDATYAFSEQGTPSLRDRLSELAANDVPEVVIVPAMLPMEPGFRAWIGRSVQRWRAAHEGAVPLIRVADPPAARMEQLSDMLGRLAQTAPEQDLLARPVAIPDRSAIPTQKRRMLVCMGGPCNDAAAAGLWQRLRAEQDRQKLRDSGEGMMSCRTSCLGPCNLAPVVQVWPEGTTYCGVDDDALDRILAEHILGGTPVGDLAYPPSRTKVGLKAVRS